MSSDDLSLALLSGQVDAGHPRVDDGDDDDANSEGSERLDGSFEHAAARSEASDQVRAASSLSHISDAASVAHSTRETREGVASGRSSGRSSAASTARGHESPQFAVSSEEAEHVNATAAPVSESPPAVASIAARAPPPALVLVPPPTAPAVAASAPVSRDRIRRLWRKAKSFAKSAVAFNRASKTSRVAAKWIGNTYRPEGRLLRAGSIFIGAEADATQVRAIELRSRCPPIFHMPHMLIRAFIMFSPCALLRFIACLGNRRCN